MPWQDHNLATSAEILPRVAQIESLSAFAGKTFTTSEAGFAAAFISFPNITFVPAVRAALCFSLSVVSYWITNFSVFFTST